MAAFRLAAIPFLMLPVCCGLDAASCECSGEGCHEIDDAGLLQLFKLKQRDMKTMESPNKAGRQGLPRWGKTQGGSGRSEFKKHGAGRASPVSASSATGTSCTPAVDESLSNGPTMKHCDIPKYVTPLVIPPVMKKSGRDRYHIAVREFQQQILPGGMWNNPAFANYNGNTIFTYSATKVWSFGPANEPQPDSSSLGGGVGIAPAPNSQFNYPAYTMETVTNRRVEVDWINHLVKDPWQCDPWNPPKCSGKGKIINARKCRQCEFLQHLLPVDQSLHWANPAKLPCAGRKKIDCMPLDSPELRKNYTGPVPFIIHVHGAHVQPQSDGFPEAWYLPAASNIPKGYATVGSLVNKYGLGRKTNLKPGIASFEYANDQPTTTLWYHDHTLGMTRNNVYAGPAGFWLIRKADGGEDGLVCGTLPHPAPKAGQSLEQTNINNRNSIREFPIVIQDRSFNADSSLFYPNGRAFFENLEENQLLIPLRGGVPVTRTDVPPEWNPEAFFDALVANGVTWPLLEVEPDIYRFRLLNGCNSRSLNLLMYVLDASGNKATEVPFYVIGGDQSLLPKVVWVMENYSTALPGDGTFPTPTPSGEGEGLFIPPAVRRDILIDFTQFPVGTLIQIFNTGPDKAPFAGFPIPSFNIDDPGSQANPGTTGQVMRFRVVSNTTIGENATLPQNLKFTLVDKKDRAADVNPAKIKKTRNLSLNEYASADVCASQVANGSIVWDPSAVVDPSNRAQCIVKDTHEGSNTSFPFGPVRALLGTVNTSTTPPVTTGKFWSDPISQLVKLDATETWAIWDFTMDSHPIHLHLVKFRIVGSRTFNPTSGALGAFVLPNPVDAGWKDTVNVMPQQVTFVKATFDIAGLYVWHCHLLEHEDNEMMVKYCVVGHLHSPPGCTAATKTGLLEMEARG